MAVNEKEIFSILDTCYSKCLNGIPMVSQDVVSLSRDYIVKHETREKACKAMIKNQIAKCATSGFLTGFGGVITLPVSLPANITSVIYVQMRMIACIAYMGGYELQSDQTRTFVYACLAGVSVNQLVKNVGVKFGIKAATGLVKKIPSKVLVKVNQKVGFRFLTKFGTKGLVNFGKMVPGVGAIIGGSLDYADTKIIANRAYKWIMEGDFSAGKGEEAVTISAEDLT